MRRLLLWRLVVRLLCRAREMATRNQLDLRARGEVVPPFLHLVEAWIERLNPSSPPASAR